MTWTNDDTANHWIATANHPDHKVYPGSDIAQCGTDKQIQNFDSCQSMGQGETFTFTFDEVGEWNYHDHLNVNPPFFGKIIVVE